MNYQVIFEPFADRHFIKVFAKKHKNAWERTMRGLVVEFVHIDLLFGKSIAEPITDARAKVVICKTEFKIAGVEESRHASGNRCIVALCRDAAAVRVLLVYHKGHLGSSNETASWKTLVKDNYPEYRGLL